jgi:hypothetical protein
MSGARGGAAVAVAVGCALLLPTQPARGDALPDAYDVSATAVGVAVQSSQRPAASVVTAGLVDTTAGYASSALSSYGAAAARAAVLYPGDLVAGGPALLCANVFPCPAAPPDYPLLADAAYPSRPTASAGPTGAGSASARAASRETRATAYAASAAVPAPVAVRVGAATVSTRTWVDGTGAHGLSRSSLLDVTIGPLRIAALEALDAVDVSTTGVVRDRPTLTLTGVTLAGQPASVDDRGVHVAGQDQALPDRALAAQGLAVRLLSTSRQDVRGAARSAAAGLLVSFSAPVSGAPQVPGVPSANRSYLGSALIGGAGAAVAAAALPSLALPELPPPAPGSASALLPPPRLLPSVPAPGDRPGATGPAPAPVLGVRRVASWLPLPDLQAVALVLLVVPLALLVEWRATTALARRTA